MATTALLEIRPRASWKLSAKSASPDWEAELGHREEADVDGMLSEDHRIMLDVKRPAAQTCWAQSIEKLSQTGAKMA